MSTNEHLTMTWDQLFTVVSQDGVIDATEATKIRERVFADGTVDRNEVEWLFKINNATTNNDASWTTLFVDAVTSWALDDQSSPNVVDETEGDWLYAQVTSDGVVDETEKAMLTALKTRATAINGTLGTAIDTLV